MMQPKFQPAFEGPYMSYELLPEQIATLRRALRHRFDELMREVQEDLAKTDADSEALGSDRVRDLGDEALADLILSVDDAETTRDLQELRDVEAALLRMKQGNYGTCLKCNAPIAAERLAAYPTAKRCLPCQRMHEMTFSSPKLASI
ncbi:MAG: TraR/DksA family transcriptional regulator [Steroidobacteraceae bacterium]